MSKEGGYILKPLFRYFWSWGRMIENEYGTTFYNWRTVGGLASELKIRDEDGPFLQPHNFISESSEIPSNTSESQLTWPKY